MQVRDTFWLSSKHMAKKELSPAAPKGMSQISTIFFGSGLSACPSETHSHVSSVMLPDRTTTCSNPSFSITSCFDMPTGNQVTGIPP